jgi:hypothetical protein
VELQLVEVQLVELQLVELQLAELTDLQLLVYISLVQRMKIKTHPEECEMILSNNDAL